MNFINNKNGKAGEVGLGFLRASRAQTSLPDLAQDCRFPYNGVAKRNWPCWVPIVSVNSCYALCYVKKLKFFGLSFDEGCAWR